jgi:flagellar hook-associated protein 3 FlgL
MTTISGFSQAARATAQAASQFKSQKDTLDTLQGQLATGKVAYTFAGLGTGATASVHLNARVATLDGYSNAIGAAQTRVKLASTGLEFAAGMAQSLGSDLIGSDLTNVAQRGQVQTLAQGNLAQMVDVLNTDVNGRYLFAGRAADTEPVASLDTILHGDGKLKGVKAVVADRIAADLGGGGLGGVTNSVAGTSVTIARDPADPATIGMTVQGAISTAPSRVFASAAGTPPAATINVAAQPLAGDALSVSFNLPDGTSKTLNLVAATTGSASGDTYAIGATPADTANNIKLALGQLLTTNTSTDLAAASTMRASTDFFDGKPAGQVVSWYKGDSDPASASVTEAVQARNTGVVQVGDHQSVAIGLRANEIGLRTTMASFAAMAVTTFSSTDTTVLAPFNALATRASAKLLGDTGQKAIQGMTADLATASLTLSDAGSRASAVRAQAQGSLDLVENADPTKVATELMAVQTRLQASYQTTAALGKLSLTDYL